MAWLLAAVVEPDDSTHVYPTGAGGYGGVDHAIELNSAGLHAVVEEEDGVGRYDAVSSPDSSERIAAGAALVKALATRKRAASFLHQLLITVRTRRERLTHCGCSRWELM